jgi:hydroxymethylpyrimidine/phosphomethylpyrimidine kinase
VFIGDVLILPLEQPEGKGKRLKFVVFTSRYTSQVKDMESIGCKSALTIAGFDPSAGAGTLADLKALSAHGIFAQACITGLTIQSTAGIKQTKALAAEWISQTLAELADDNSFSVIKIGALFTSDIVREVAAFLRQHRKIPVVCDPVLASTSGVQLIDSDGIGSLQSELFPLCDWLTPNWGELGILTDMPVANGRDAEQAVERLRASFPQINLVVTGGDRQTPDDLLVSPGQGPQWIEGHRVETASTHGTGCTFSSAIAARLALYPDEPPAERVAACKRYVEGAMRHAKPMGRGAGSLNHFWACDFAGEEER